MVYVDLDSASGGTAAGGTSDGSAARGVCEAFLGIMGATYLVQKLVEWGQWSMADRVEVRYEGPKGDQLRKVAILTQASKGPPKPVGAGEGAVEVVVELLSCYLFFPASAPLVAFGCGSGRWSTWTQAQATRALRQVLSAARVQPRKYALYSLRFGGATHLSAEGGAPGVLKREARWASGAYIWGTYVIMAELHIGCPEW